VFFVINDLERAGAETQLVRLAAALPRDRYEPRIVILKRHNAFVDELSAAGIPVIVLDRRGPWDLGVAVRLYRLLARERPHIVHSYLLFASLLAVPAARLAGAPVVIVSQRCSYDATVPFLWRWIARRLHRYADRVIVNSQAALREEDAGGVPADRLLYIPNAIDVSIGAAGDRAAFGLPAGPLAVCVGQLAREKGHLYLLAAWAQVRERVSDATLVLVGDGPLRAELEAAARRYGVADRVRFLGRRHDAHRLAGCADLCVLASLTEGMPNALLEAMAAGRAVVATRVGGIPDLVEDGHTGLLVPPAQPAALAEALVALLLDPARRAQLGEAGRRRAQERFATERVTAEVTTTYDALLAGRR